MATVKPVLDVSGRVDVSDHQVVCDAVREILRRPYPDADSFLLEALYRDFYALYSGQLEGFIACETHYHDIQHVLDVSLAMARLIDGYEIDCAVEGRAGLGFELAMIGMTVAIFHDSGYIRRREEHQVEHGAEYTKTHVSRSARFMAEYLPTIGMAEWVPITDKLVHFTGYEQNPADIDLASEQYRVLGYLVGTADVIAQMADVDYLIKCRDRLYPEFELGGIARQQLPDGSEHVVYSSAEDLLVKTPAFIKQTITERLDGYFAGYYHYVAAHFGGPNLYMEALEKNCQHLEFLLAQGDPSLLTSSSLRPE